MSDIQFTLTRSHFGDVPTRRAACDFLGISEEHMRALMQADKTLTVTATAAQFGQFIAARCIYGCTGNTIMNMNPKMIINEVVCAKPALVTNIDIRNASRC